MRPSLKAFFFLFFALLAAGPAKSWSQGVAASDIVTNAGAADLQQIQTLAAGLDKAVANRDANTLRFYGIVSFPAQYTILAAASTLTHADVTAQGALVRLEYRVYGYVAQGQQGALLSYGHHELWLARDANGYLQFSTTYWNYPDEIVPKLVEAANDEWAALDKSNQPAILHLVAQERGGRWLPLRRSHWDGAVYDDTHLSNIEDNAPANDTVEKWLVRQLNSYVAGQAGTAHFMMQRGPHGWVGLETVWEPATHIAAADENSALTQRRALQGTAYLGAQNHSEFATALSSVGLYSEAADELEKAELLQPGIAGQARLQQARALRADDPQAITNYELNNEAKVGLGSDHPTYMINELERAQETNPTALGALRIGLEYAKLADDRDSTSWLNQAYSLLGHTATPTSTDDAAWIKVLSDHLKERERIAELHIKPANLIRSALFAVRCAPNDPSVLKVLAALESAQHRVYSDFGIPMSSTEVVLWPSQTAFQNYTSQYSRQGVSEFVAALTLTKLIDTHDGPMVLGEEVNVFIDPRTNLFSTIAHEYGHVAVRELSRGRAVPVWFNEGIATSVEGGYEGYIPRVHNAAENGALLGMADMREWHVDGQRAFLAYSQANSMVDFIVSRPNWGRQAVLNILRQIGRDVPPDQAFQSVLGMSQEELWRNWAAFGIR